MGKIHALRIAIGYPLNDILSVRNLTFTVLYLVVIILHPNNVPYNLYVPPVPSRAYCVHMCKEVIKYL